MIAHIETGGKGGITWAQKRHTKPLLVKVWLLPFNSFRLCDLGKQAGREPFHRLEASIDEKNRFLGVRPIAQKRLVRDAKVKQRTFATEVAIKASWRQSIIIIGKQGFAHI